MQVVSVNKIKRTQPELPELYASASNLATWHQYILIRRVLFLFFVKRQSLPVIYTRLDLILSDANVLTLLPAPFTKQILISTVTYIEIRTHFFDHIFIVTI